MLYSQFFTKTERQAPSDEVSINAKLLIQAGYVDKLMAGVYSLLPLGLRVYKKIEQIIREEMDAIGGQELVMPSLQPKENWEKTGRWTAMDDLYQLKVDDKEYAIGPTHEEVIAPIAKRYISSYKDLPKYAYQFQTKFRNEKRAKSGVMRGREFSMKDLYSFHADQADLDNFYEKAIVAYKNVFKRCGIGNLTYLTYASGGTFSKYSHEFPTLTRAGEDLIYICEQCKVAINKEILDDLKSKCPVCGGNILREEKAVEVGNIFKLGTKYTEPFDLFYTDKDGNKKLVIMGCYGIGLTRLMGAVVEVSSDDKGIIWPEAVAPFKVNLISLNKDAEAEKIYKDLRSAGIEVLYDDRSEVSAGEKFADSDLIGCPWRVVVSGKTLAENAVEVKQRSKEKCEIIKINDLIKTLR